MNCQKITLTKQELLQILQDYYKESAKVSINAKKELMGIYEEETCAVHIKVSKSMLIGNTTVQIVEELKEEELINILNEILSSQGYRVNRNQFLTNLKTKTEGYGMGESTSSYAEFKGIELYVQKTLDQQKIKTFSIENRGGKI